MNKDIDVDLEIATAIGLSEQDIEMCINSIEWHKNVIKGLSEYEKKDTLYIVSNEKSINAYIAYLNMAENIISGTFTLAYNTLFNECRETIKNGNRRAYIKKAVAACTALSNVFLTIPLVDAHSLFNLNIDQLGFLDSDSLMDRLSAISESIEDHHDKNHACWTFSATVHGEGIAQHKQLIENAMKDLVINPKHKFSETSNFIVFKLCCDQQKQDKDRFKQFMFLMIDQGFSMTRRDQNGETIKSGFPVIVRSLKNRGNLGANDNPYLIGSPS